MIKNTGIFILLITSVFITTLMFSCGNNNRDAGKVLQVEEVDPGDITGGNTDDGNTGGDTDGSGTGIGDTGSDETDSGDNGLHPIFFKALGVPISNTSSGVIDPDPSGLSASTDYDGDGIPNQFEIISNPFVADYPRIVTSISAPITMEIRISYSSVQENHTETIENSDVEDTIKNSMEDKQYAQANQKTTPYISKESYENSGSHSEAFGDSDSTSVTAGGSVSVPGFSGSANSSRTDSASHNESLSDSFSESTMSEGMVFEDVDYIDNLDRNGVEFTNETVQKIAQNYRKSEVLKDTQNIGPNDGVVRAALFLKNMTVNMPVRISNVICTLSFRTPSGEFLPIKTFKLRNEDYSEFSHSIYGNEELGPYTIEIANLNTFEVMKALENGYIPQIHVVSYDMHKVEDSNYNPGVENLKIVEETAKGRTALIKIVGTNLRESYRVAAFDVNQNGDIIPGISLKKALFNILRSRTNGGEQWDENQLTINDSSLRWKPGSTDPNNYIFNEGIEGNSWDKFETYIKTYTDEYNTIHKIETVKRIGELVKYNPFNQKDNPSYNPNELLSDSEINKMKYWLIYHNGRYFNGDINDPIWVGERYEIVCIDVADFNKHFEGYNYTPIQSKEKVYLDTRWNRLNNDGPFSRAVYLGKIIQGDVIHLEVDLLRAKSLFNITTAGATFQYDSASNTNRWYDDNFNYTFQPENQYIEGVPGEFTHSVKGGTNNLTVDIIEAQFAFFYEIAFGVLNTSETTWKKVSVTGDDLKRNNWKLVITRNTLDTENNPVGEIQGGLTYGVKVKALGSIYGVSVATNSISNGLVDSSTDVDEAPVGTLPGSFTYGATGILSGIDVRIADGANIEYYIIEYQGPFNYNTGSGDPPVVTRAGNSGVNRLTVDNPAGEVVDPGVYKLKVYAVNRNNIGNGLVSATGEQHILVAYERYRDQKIYSPVVKGQLESLDSIDLEVNFNDGQGWFRLKLSDLDVSPQSIDCMYTSYVEYNRQKFHLFFRLPEGTGGGINETVPSDYNVFAGGRDEADIYIRTAADKKYRDTFWPKISTTSDYYVSTPSTVNDFINYWMIEEYTDASHIEDTLSGNYTGTFSLSSTSIGDYFFSPYEYRFIGLKVLLQDSMVEADISRIDPPVFSAAEGDRGILVTIQAAAYAEKIKIFWKQVDGLTGPQINDLMNDTNLNGWDWDEQLAAALVSGSPYTIANLQQYSKYVVAVKSINRYGKVSATAFHKSGTDLAALIPWTSATPLAPAGVNLNLGADGHSIHVNNIYVPGEEHYQVEWRNESGSITSSHVVTGDGVNPATYYIEELNFWDRYFIKVAAVNKHIIPFLYGPFSDELMINTIQDHGSPGTTAASWSGAGYEQTGFRYEWSGIDSVKIDWRKWYDEVNIDLSSITVPEGAVKYSVTWVLKSNQGNIVGEVSNRAILNRDQIEVMPVQLVGYNEQDTSTYISANLPVISNVSVSFTIIYYNLNNESVSFDYFSDLGTWNYYYIYPSGWKNETLE